MWESAACRDLDPEMFFDPTREATKVARRVCAPCPVRNRCLLDALLSGSVFGMWGGLTETERAGMHTAVSRGKRPEAVTARMFRQRERLDALLGLRR